MSRVLVVSDAMLDRYHFGLVERFSQEALVPVFRRRSSEDRAGGAANLAVNLRSLGVNVHLVSLIGDDPEGHSLRRALMEAGVEIQACAFFRDGRPTPLKERFAAEVHGQFQLVFRSDREVATECEQNVEQIGRRVRQALIDQQFDLLLVSDYGKGTVRRELIRELIDTPGTPPVVVDPCSRTEAMDIKGVYCATPNRAEFCRWIGCAEPRTIVLDQLAREARRLACELDIRNLVVTLDREGMLLARPGREPAHVPTRPRQVSDVTGAGDVVVALIAAMAAEDPLGCDWLHILRQANAAAGRAVEQFGTTVIAHHWRVDQTAPPHATVASHAAGSGPQE